MSTYLPTNFIPIPYPYYSQLFILYHFNKSRLIINENNHMFGNMVIFSNIKYKIKTNQFIPFCILPLHICVF